MTSDNWFTNDQNAVYFLTFTIVDWVDGMYDKIPFLLPYSLSRKGTIHRSPYSLILNLN
jgi:hypothetical protein